MGFFGLLLVFLLKVAQFQTGICLILLVITLLRGRLHVRMTVKSTVKVLREIWHSFPSPLLTLLLWPLAIPILALKGSGRGGGTLNHGSDDVIVEEIDQWLNQSATDCAAGIRSGKITSEQLTKRCLHQLSKFNAKLNSAVATRHNEALEEAKRADDAISRGVAPSPDTIQGRLWGVPILVKECFEMKGMPFTGGVVARRSMIGSQDAPVIKALKEAGLIIIASTNTSEACSKCVIHGLSFVQCSN
jgi:hypothetical protein